MILKLQKREITTLLNLNYENESYCRMLRLKSGKSEVLNESGREFHSFEAIYEKECRP